MINGPYTLSVNVTDPGPIGLWFDYLIYEPGDPQTAVKSNIYRIDKSDPAIVYSSGWGMFGDFANGTNTPDAQLSLTFEGQGISFLGYTAAELPHPAAVASYSIDRVPPVNFSLNGIDGNDSSSIFDLELFGVTGLAPGSHDLSVVYLGDKTKTALALNYFQVLGSIPGSNITTNSTAPPTSPTQPPSNSNDNTLGHHASHLSTGAIVGILVGVSFFVSMAVGLFFFMRKRRRPPEDVETRRPQSGWLSTFKSYQRELAQAGPGPTSFSSSIVSSQANPQSYDRYTSAPSIRSSTEQIHYTQRLSPVRRKMPSYDMGGQRIQPPSRALARNASSIAEALPQYSA
ncbi:hypothetical protein BD779DRAFT_1671452 [Infundibulicybe gibba]|nr:hypothetical protein BD779DRAFT_1671452 [Infundibulicybe gibba]